MAKNERYKNIVTIQPSSDTLKEIRIEKLIRRKLRKQAMRLHAIQMSKLKKKSKRRKTD